MLVVFIKCAIIFFIVFITIRIMGKRELGQMQPYELVITLIIAEVACLPMNDPSIPLYFCIIPVVTLAFLEVFIAFLSKKCNIIRKLTDGEAMIVFDKNGVNVKNLSRLNMSVSDLIEAIRSSGTVDIIYVEYVIIETNGKLCVVEKNKNQNGTQKFLPISIISNGKFDEQNLLKTGVEKVNIFTLLNSNGVMRVKSVLFADVRQDGTVYFVLSDRKDLVGKIEIKEGIVW